MKQICPDPLIAAIERLTEQIGAADVKIEQMEKLARVISAQFKALQDIQNYNLKLAQQGDDKKYLSYEDFPPPNPEERERFKNRLEHLIAKIEVKEPIPNID